MADCSGRAVLRTFNKLVFTVDIVVTIFAVSVMTAVSTLHVRYNTLSYQEPAVYLVSSFKFVPLREIYGVSCLYHNIYITFDWVFVP